MEWKKRRKTKLVSVLLILVLLIVNSVSYILADEYAIPSSELSEETETQDRANVLANSISGVIWLDENGNGILDEGEEPIWDYPVYLYSKDDLSAEVQKVITDQEGKYEFSELEPGEYIVGVKAEENETEYLIPEAEVTDNTTNKFTADAELLTDAYSEIITIAEDSIATDISCGMWQTAEQDAEQTESEDAVSNNVINDDTNDTSDTKDNENIEAVDDTDSNDSDSINDENGQETEHTDNGEDNELQNEDSADLVQETDTEQSLDYSISPSDLETDTDTNSISGLLWLDANTDGIYDTDEQTVSEYPVYLFKSDDTSTAVETVLTDSEGKYKFTNLEPAEYKVGVQAQTIGTTEYLIPIKSFQTGSDNKLDADWNTDPIISVSESITIAADTVVTDINAGMRGIPAAQTSSDGSYVVSGDMTGTYTTLYDACGAINSDGGTTYTITATQDDDGAAQTMPATIAVGKEVTLTSDTSGPWTITRTRTTLGYYDRYRHISIYGELTIKNIIISGIGLMSGNYSNGGVIVKDGGKLTMEDGAVIENCYNSNSQSEGGVTVDDTSSKTIFIMNGGEIRNNFTFYYAATFCQGGGVHIEGDGSGHIAFYMNGGRICDNGFVNNTTVTSPTCQGGGVFLYYAGFVMNDGEISDNVTGGGGIYVYYNSIFKMYGGVISDNTGLGGAGVNIQNESSTFYMYGGTIKNNTSTNSGGGVVVYTDCNFYMYGGTISNNSCNGSTYGGGGVALWGGTLTMSGSSTSSCYITNNTAAANGGGVWVNTRNQQDGVLNMTTDYCYITSNKADSNGGGVYLAAASAIMTTTGGSITNNTAGGDGGGIYTADTPSYSNIKTDSTTAFAGNKAQRYCNPPTHAATYFPDIKSSSISLTLTELESLHPLNNYDINCDTIKLTYEPNSAYGGQGTSYNEYYIKAADVTILDNTDSHLGFTNSDSGYYFDGWNDATDGDGTSYTVGTAYTLSADATIYAQWRRSTGSITIEKYGDSTTPLPGAEFTIEQQNGTAWEYITYDASAGIWSVSSTAGEYTLTTATDSSGDVASLTFINLPLGKYRLTEVKAPSGYALLAKQIEVEIPYYDSTDYYYDLTYTVSDVAVIDLPDAGSGLTMRTIVLTGAGIALLSAVAYIYARKRRGKIAALQS